MERKGGENGCITNGTTPIVSPGIDQVNKGKHSLGLSGVKVPTNRHGNFQKRNKTFLTAAFRRAEPPGGLIVCDVTELFFISNEWMPDSLESYGPASVTCPMCRKSTFPHRPFRSVSLNVRFQRPANCNFQLIACNLLCLLRNLMC